MIGYPSDITRQQFELIRSDLEAVRQRTRPRQVDLYEIFNAVLYILRTGSQWRQLPADFPNWQSVYYYYRVWSEEQIIDEPSILDKCWQITSLIRTSPETFNGSLLMMDF